MDCLSNDRRWSNTLDELSRRRWAATEAIALGRVDEFRSQGYQVGQTKVRQVLKQLGCSLQGKDTAEVAVEAIRRWWNELGKKLYKHPKRILITADCGGSKVYRNRLWKFELQ